MNLLKFSHRRLEHVQAHWSRSATVVCHVPLHIESSLFGFQPVRFGPSEPSGRTRFSERFPCGLEPKPPIHKTVAWLGCTRSATGSSPGSRSRRRLYPGRGCCESRQAGMRFESLLCGVAGILSAVENRIHLNFRDRTPNQSFRRYTTAIIPAAHDPVVRSLACGGFDVQMVDVNSWRSKKTKSSRSFFVTHVGFDDWNTETVLVQNGL
jgi:hypothetical protein